MINTPRKKYKLKSFNQRKQKYITYKNSSPFDSKTRQESVAIEYYGYGPIKI